LGRSSTLYMPADATKVTITAKMYDRNRFIEILSFFAK